MFSGKKYDTNLLVIGAGSAGLISANIAATLKAKVTLIERHKMGGDCLNTGCVPSKTLLRSAKIRHLMNDSERYGLKAADVAVDFPAVMGRVQSIIKHIEPNDSVERYTSLGVDCISGDAKLVSPNEVLVNGEKISARHIILAMGARPFIPEIAGLDAIDYLTSDNIWQLEELPKSMLVMGSGAIACEMSQAFSRLGSEVTMVQRSSSILNKEEPEVGEFMLKAFEQEGIQVKLNSKISEVRKAEGGGVEVCLQDESGEQSWQWYEQILLAVGRKANTDGMGLEEVGVELNADGTVKVDEYLRSSSHQNILACGDVAGPYQFTHMASHQAWYATVNSLFGFVKKFKVDYRIVPKAVFTDPEIASVGKLESELKAEGVAFEAVHFPLDDMDRALAEGEAKGFIKVLLKDGSDKILGVTIVGAHAAELITEFIHVIKMGKGLNHILGTIHIYPSFSEANKYLAGQWKRKHAPQWALKILQKLHAWRR
ncbi:FAD-dependent oxidoreductase [uncultured Pseudoteredinibacter sp.]|uniref:dihydrolipoyl dehydrogenase family protein n=1 Tax=uncultured Pseudoteredinibacter sp. TaxID=1641701 RepID=UPI002619230D|nr:FAD-dependent oxidoreductase [uncultured Pseudoteredinibacter sp.]